MLQLTIDEPDSSYIGCFFLFFLQVFADIQFRVGDKLFKAHRCVLAARYEYFNAMFGNSFTESQQTIFEVEDVDPKIFKSFLTFIYTNHVKLCSVTARKLLVVADKTTCAQTWMNIMQMMI